MKNFNFILMELIYLLCYVLEVRKKEVLSKLVSPVAIFKEIEKTDPELCEILLNDFYFDARAQNPNENKFKNYQFLLNTMVLFLDFTRKYIETALRGF